MRAVAAGACIAALAVTVAGASCGRSSKSHAAVGGTTSSAPAPTVTIPTVPSTTTTTAAVPGTVHIGLTQPVQSTVVAHAQVECDAENGHFLAQATVPTGDAAGDDISFSVNVPGYRGPQTYRAEVTVEILAPDGQSTKTTVSQDVHVAPPNGSFAVATKADNGKPINATIDWICS